MAEKSIALNPADKPDNVITTERFTRMEHELTLRSRMQSAVAELGQASLSDVDTELLIGQACALVADTLSVEYCRVLEYLNEQQRLIPRAAVGWKKEEDGEEVDSEAMFTFLSEKPVVFDDLRTETRFGGAPVLERIGVVSGLSVPLRGRGQAFGVLGAYSAAARVFRSYEIEFVQSIANVLAAAMESRSTRQELAESRAQIFRREQLGNIGSWSWSRGTRQWQWSNEIHRMIGIPTGTHVDIDTFLEHIAADDRVAFSSLIDRACQEPGEHAMEHRLITADGEVRVARTVIEAIFGSSRKPLRIIGTTQDITESAKATQEQMRLGAMIELAAQEWRMTCDAIDALVIVADTNLTMLRVNERTRKLLRMSFDEAIGQQLPSPILGEPWATMRQLATVVSETGVTATVRAHDTIRSKSWEIAARALNTARAIDERVVIVATDVTEQEMRERIRHDSDLLDAVTQVISAISARSGAPIATLSELLARHLDQITLSSTELRRARSATHDLTRLFRNLDEYSRPFELAPEPQSVLPIIERAIDHVSLMAARRNVHLEFSAHEDLGEILVNERRLEELFRDLLTLFVERTMENENVGITLSTTPWRREEWVGLVFSTGRHIFSRAELQWSLDSTLPRVDGDDGLRLSIDQRIVEEHGGVMLMANRSDAPESFLSLRFPPFRRN
jgi:PAS domain S-box-containing protein